MSENVGLLKTVEKLRRKIEVFGASGDPEALAKERSELLDLVATISQNAEAVQEEHQIVDDCLEGLVALASLNFDHELEPRGDERLAALALGINMLSEELQSSTVSLDFVKSILDSMAESLLVVDSHGRIRLVNQATQRMTGQTQEAMVGQHVECLGGLTRDDVVSALASLVEGASYEQLTTYRNRDGRETPIALSVRALAKHPGGEQLFVWVGRDMRARLKLEEDLREARDAAIASDVAKSEFLANMSHEIRTPLNGIMGMLELLMGTELSAAQHEMAKTSASSAEVLLSVINDILDFSKIEAGKLSFDTVVFEVGGLLEDCARILGLRAEQKGLELTAVFLSAEPQWVRGDPGRLRQIIINLLTNAIKFTHRGEVKVSATIAARSDTEVTIRVSVKDTGIGIPKERLGVLFNAFVQADGSTTRKYGGTGLGLTICKSLVEMFNGTLQVDSKPGDGSEFWFTARLERVATPEPVPARAPGELADLRLLIVDDNPTNRRILQFHAQAWGISCHLAEDGRAALAELRRAAKQACPYELMISDMHMPGMEGASLIAAVEADPGVPTPKILILTSIGSRDDLLSTTRPYRFLTKPVKKSELRDQLLGLLSETAKAPSKAPLRVNVTPTPAREQVILVAEDNQVNLKVVRAMLTRIGITSHGVTNGIAAIEALRHHSYSMVFMDCQMPGMDGYEATRQIRAHEHDTYLPIVALTANALVEERQRCLLAGMDDHLPKPVTIKLLSQMVARWLVDAAPTGNRPILPTSASERTLAPAPPVYTQATSELLSSLWQKAKDTSIAIRDAFVDQDLQQVAAHAQAFQCHLSGDHVAPAVAIAHRLGQQARSGEREAAISELHRFEHEAYLMLSCLRSNNGVGPGRT